MYRKQDFWTKYSKHKGQNKDQMETKYIIKNVTIPTKYLFFHLLKL